MLIRHQSILDILSKGQEASARVNRAVVKSVTSCGCIQINAEKQSIPENTTFSDLREAIKTHFEGELCPNCRDIAEIELGKQLFYMAALTNVLGLSIDEVIQKEKERLNTLTVFNFR